MPATLGVAVGLIVLAIYAIVAALGNLVDEAFQPGLSAIFHGTSSEGDKMFWRESLPTMQMPHSWRFAVQLGIGLALLVLNRPISRWFFKGAGFCAHCGYDLRGTTGEQCPECGQALPSHRKTTGNAVQPTP